MDTEKERMYYRLHVLFGAGISPFIPAPRLSRRLYSTSIARFILAFASCQIVKAVAALP